MAPPHRALVRAAVTSGIAVALAGCSLLVDFVTHPTPTPVTDDDACVDCSPEGAVPDADAGGNPDEAGESDVLEDKVVVDVFVEAAQCPDPCEGRSHGFYCGNDGLKCTAPADDLYICDSGAVADVTHCTSGCVPLPSGYPDTCDPCLGLADGKYCGRDLAIVPKTTALEDNYLFHCVDGLTQTSSQPCISPKQCVGGGGNAKCQ